MLKKNLAHAYRYWGNLKMKCNQISSISFKKKLMANAAILSKNMPEKVSIYELDNREEKDKMYFEKLAESTDWRKGLFRYSMHRSISHSKRNEHFYVMEDKNNNCLGYMKIKDDSELSGSQDVEYIETNPKYVNYHGQSDKKYIGETLLAFLAKFYGQNDSDAIVVKTPTLPAEDFYIDKCCFVRQVDDEPPVTLTKQKFNELLEQNKNHTNTEIEMVV